jgi:hypothetical protein
LDPAKFESFGNIFSENFFFGQGMIINRACRREVDGVLELDF